MTARRTAVRLGSWAAGLFDDRGWAAGPTVVSILASGMAAATTFFVAHEIGAVGFGRFSVITSIALIFGVGMLMSLNFVMYQELPRADPRDRPALVTTALLATLAVALSLAAVGFAASPLLAPVLGVDGRTLAFSLALAVALTVNLLTESFLRGLRRFAYVTSLKFAGALAHVAVCAYCLLVLGIREPDFYILTLIITNMAFAVVAVAGSGVVLRSWSRTLLRSLYRHGAYVTAIAALATVLFGIDMIFLNHWTTPGDVGVYSVYNGFPKRLLGVVFTEGIGLVLLPSLATMDKPALLRRIGRIAPVLGVSTTIFSLAASALFFLPLGAEYSYSIGLMALSAVGIGAHTVYNLYYFALSMDGLRGAKVVILCLASGLPVAISCQAAFIYWWGVVGALIAFALTNLIILAVVIFASARVYRLAGRTRTQEVTA